MLTTYASPSSQTTAPAVDQPGRNRDAAALMILDLLASGGILETTRLLPERRYALRIGRDIPVTGRVSRCLAQRLEPNGDGFRIIFRADLVFDPPSPAVWARLLAFAEELTRADPEQPLPIVLVDRSVDEP